MRILVLNYEFPPVGGGGGRFAEDICRVLAKRGHNIRVQTGHVKGLPMVEERDGYHIYRTPHFRRHMHTCSVTEMATFLVSSALPALYHTLTWKPDIMHVHFAVPSGVLGLFVHTLTQIPFVITIQLGDVPGGNPDQTDYIFRYIKPLTVPIWQRAKAVIAVSTSIRTLALQSYDVPILIITNGLDMTLHHQPSFGLHSPPRLVFAGRFNPQKNLLFLIDVLQHMADIPWELDLVGDGPLRQAVASRVQEVGLSERVHFHGWVSSDMVDTIMQQSDVLVLPSTSEGLPITGLQALKHGLAILGSDIGGTEDVVEHGINGFLCPVNNMQCFEHALRLMLTTQELIVAMKQSSRQKAQAFDIETIGQEYEAILLKGIEGFNQR